MSDDTSSLIERNKVFEYVRRNGTYDRNKRMAIDFNWKRKSCHCLDCCDFFALGFITSTHMGACNSRGIVFGLLSIFDT